MAVFKMVSSTDVCLSLYPLWIPSLLSPHLITIDLLSLPPSLPPSPIPSSSYLLSSSYFPPFNILYPTYCYLPIFLRASHDLSSVFFLQSFHFSHPCINLAFSCLLGSLSCPSLVPLVPQFCPCLFVILSPSSLFSRFIPEFLPCLPMCLCLIRLSSLVLSHLPLSSFLSVLYSFFL